MNLLALWTLRTMIALAEPGRPLEVGEPVETREEALVRYQAIAEALSDVVQTEDPLWPDKQSRAMTAAVMLGIQYHESGGWKKSVDLGLPPAGRGDKGRSVCLAQINVGSGRSPAYNIVKKRLARGTDPPAEVVQGWTSAELLADRRKCMTAQLRAIKASFGACRHLDLPDRLRVYASGSCTRGGQAARDRFNTGMGIFYNRKPHFTDGDLAKALMLASGT